MRPSLTDWRKKMPKAVERLSPNSENKASAWDLSWLSSRIVTLVVDIISSPFKCIIY